MSARRRRSGEAQPHADKANAESTQAAPVPTSDSENPGPGRSTAGLITLGGVALLGLGMALVFSGLVTPALFRPGTLLIGLGMLVSAAGGALAVARPTTTR